MDCGSPHILITDLAVSFYPPTDGIAACALNSPKWRRIEKELYLHTAQQSAWVHVAQSEEKELTADDLVIHDIKIGELCPNSSLDESWESRPGGIWGTFYYRFRGYMRASRNILKAFQLENKSHNSAPTQRWIY